jgi:hypothetical protein
MGDSMTPHYECGNCGRFFPAAELRWHDGEPWSLEHLRRHGIDASALPRYVPTWERVPAGSRLLYVVLDSNTSEALDWMEGDPATVERAAYPGQTIEVRRAVAVICERVPGVPR